MKFGSKATPSNPRSPDESTVTVRKGVGSSAPFLMTPNAPPCWQTKIRPSGARAMAVGVDKPPATTESVNPDGTVAALVIWLSVDVIASKTTHRTKQSENIELLEFMAASTTIDFFSWGKFRSG